MKKFEKHKFLKNNKHALIGAFIEESTLRKDSDVEIVFNQLEPGFRVAPHIHTLTKTVVIVLEGAMTFSIDGETLIVRKGEYVVFDKGLVEEVIAVKANTQNLTIHVPSILGGDKKEI